MSLYAAARFAAFRAAFSRMIRSSSTRRRSSARADRIAPRTTQNVNRRPKPADKTHTSTVTMRAVVASMPLSVARDSS